VSRLRAGAPVKEVMARTESLIISIDRRLAVYKERGIDTITMESPCLLPGTVSTPFSMNLTSGG